MFKSFDRYIGIDYSGAKTPTESLKGLRVYLSDGDDSPREEPSPPSPPPHNSRKHWTRKGIAYWLVERLSEDVPTLVGIDHAFSFPLCYFREHKLSLDWSSFLDDFQHHWPTDEDNTTVDSIRENLECAKSPRAVKLSWRRWFRLTEERAKRGSSSAKSVFHFDVQGQVAKSTHAGIPWLRFMRQKQIGVHFWPFDGWEIPQGKSAIVEVYPALWSSDFATEGRKPDQHDAYSVAKWLSSADRDGRLAKCLKPNLTALERNMAEVEGWILGVDSENP